MSSSLGAEGSRRTQSHPHPPQIPSVSESCFPHQQPTAEQQAQDRHGRWLERLSDAVDDAMPRQPHTSDIDYDDCDDDPSQVGSPGHASLMARSPQEQAEQRPAAPSLDMAHQQRLVKQHRLEMSRRWVERHTPPSVSSNDRKHMLHLLLLEADRYHDDRRSTSLNRKIADCVAIKQKGAPIPPNLVVDPQSTRLAKSVLHQLCFDLDWIVDNCRQGPQAALQSLEEMRIWRMEADTAGERTARPSSAPPS